ncbi:unnamed protein product [Allacma fusca]|uniref:Uncharacterized protein n=1 Tax=Allacma fusca TaxID=39272 RepID=A0A8J2LQW4_9HEXA|nr:unnamed protein product [Allacma fusca]
MLSLLGLQNIFGENTFVDTGTGIVRDTVAASRSLADAAVQRSVAAVNYIPAFGIESLLQPDSFSQSERSSIRTDSSKPSNLESQIPGFSLFENLSNKTGLGSKIEAGISALTGVSRSNPPDNNDGDDDGDESGEGRDPNTPNPDQSQIVQGTKPKRVNRNRTGLLKLFGSKRRKHNFSRKAVTGR